MGTRSYGQYCGFARALELVGERWAFLIIRDLMIGRKRFSELQRGLPKIPTNVLTTRLKELELAGLIERKAVARSEGAGVAYELTGDGRDLQPAVTALGRWGAKRLGDVREGEVVTEDSIRSALLTTFQPDAAGGPPVGYDLLLGPIAINAVVTDGKLTVGSGALDRADLRIEAGPAIRAVMAGEIEPREAVDAGIVRLHGDIRDFERFARMFRI
ncbi:MAG TPA: helix-turn-helix domain-containing protein [Candidatus Acidoferrum sp.]|nr:helix-turn-helix domain-containing protein [Candidatus Acidoferrum sp.]